MSFFGELKRRNVFRVGIAYLIAAWLLLQIVDVVSPMLALPEWLGPTVLILLVVGFVVAVFVAWAYEITPEGIKRERDVDRSESITHMTGRKLDFAIIGVLVVALGFFAFERFVWHDHDEPVPEFVELEKSIAVLPFANRSDDESDANFVDGIHDDILTQLANLSGIDKVISRTSVEQYRGTEKTVPEIAGELGVATILEGGVQRAGNSIRINIQLISADDQHLWAENYDRQLTIENMFAIQSEIAVAIANELSAALTEEDENDLAKLPTDSLEAWEKYQLGKFVMKDRSAEGLAQGRALFREAIELDEEFALAHVGLNDAITLGFIYGWEDDNISLQDVNALRAEGQSAAERALQINPRLGEAYASLGYAQFNIGNPENLFQADSYYAEAVRLSPNYATLFRWYPQTLWQYPLNQPVKALSMAERAVALNPVDAINRVVLANAYEINGRYQEALASIVRAKEILPTLVYANWEHVGLLRRHNRYSSAIVIGLESQAWLPDYPRILWEITLAYRQLGDIDKTAFWLNRTLQTGQSFYSNVVRAEDATEEEDFESAVYHYELALEELPYDLPVIQDLVRAYARNTQSEEILDLLASRVPEILNRENTEVIPQGVQMIPAVAWALRSNGESERAAELLDLGLHQSPQSPRQAFFGYGIEAVDVEMHVMMADHRSALSTLSRVVADGYRNREWLENSPFLEPIRSEPEFLAAMEVIRADLARQRAELEEMERNGELPPLPQ